MMYGSSVFSSIFVVTGRIGLFGVPIFRYEKFPKERER